MQNKSTLNNLVCYTQYILDALDYQGQIDVMYTDIQKAFDQVDHVYLTGRIITHRVFCKLIGFNEIISTKQSNLCNMEFLSQGNIWLLQESCKALLLFFHIH